ncbi:MAG TPA: hypothetical protein DD435_16785 [Cyanobacteria bacterium UBA8530]|nr:hypothetical protein [Cyanobacteria bacterium UBA8530]
MEYSIGTIVHQISVGVLAMKKQPSEEYPDLESRIVAEWLARQEQPERYLAPQTLNRLRAKQSAYFKKQEREKTE